MIILFALLIAPALFILGVKELKAFPEKRKGLFFMTIMLALGFFNLCTGARSEEGAPYTDADCELSGEDIHSLFNTPEWENLKAFWKRPAETKVKREAALKEKEKPLRKLYDSQNAAAQECFMILMSTRNMMARYLLFRKRPWFRSLIC